MIQVNFSAYDKYVTDSLYQWDIGQELKVTGLNLTKAPEVHFSNANMDRAIVKQAEMADHVVTVAIPNSLLQDPLRIYAHIGVYEGATFKTVEVVEIPVIARKRPLDYQITNNDEELYSFKSLENALKNKADNTDAEALGKRIDNIVANANSTEGNSELVDVRYGADGTVYTSAGEAVREQVGSAVATSSAALFSAPLRNLASNSLIKSIAETNVETTDNANGSVSVETVNGQYGKRLCWFNAPSWMRKALFYIKYTVSGTESGNNVFLEYTTKDSAGSETTNRINLAVAENGDHETQLVLDVPENAVQIGLAVYGNAVGRVITFYGYNLFDVTNTDETDFSALINYLPEIGYAENLSGAAVQNLCESARVEENIEHLLANENKNALGFITSTSTTAPVLAFDTAAKTCVVRNGYLYSTKYADIVPLTSIPSVDLSGLQDGLLVFNINTSEFYARSRTTALADNEVLIASYANYGQKVNSLNSYSIDGALYGAVSDEKQTILSPEYEVINLSGVKDWSDFIVVGDKLVLFCPSSEENHINADGYIYVCNKATGEVEKRFKHDFGHCNTCDYRNGTLLIGNLPGSATYNAALYVIYNFDALLDNASETVFSFAGMDKTIVDLSGISGASQIAACWGENNKGTNNIVYVSANFNRHWYKILLGVGTDGKFNGSYHLLDSMSFELEYSADTEVIQGVGYYAGRIITANGHDSICGFIWERTKIGKMTRKEIRVRFYTTDGTLVEAITEGLFVDDGYVLHGCIETNGDKYIAKYKYPGH